MPTFSRSNIIALLGIIVVLGVLGILTYERLSPQGRFADLQNDLKALQPEEPLYTDLDGNTVDLSIFKGKPLIINSWATWMPFSKDDLALLAKAKESYGDVVQIIAINRMEPVERIRSYKSTFSLPDNIIFLVDPIDHFYKTTQGYAMPETIFYTHNGTIMQHTRGTLTEQELMTYIDSIIDN